MAWGFRVPVYPKISGTETARAVLNNLARNPYAAALCIDGEDGGTGAAYNVSMDKMGHPIASNIRDCYLDLVKQGKQNELPLIAAGGVGKGGNLAANAAALLCSALRPWTWANTSCRRLPAASATSTTAVTSATWASARAALRPRTRLAPEDLAEIVALRLPRPRSSSSCPS